MDTWMGRVVDTWMGRVGDTWMGRIGDTWMGRIGDTGYVDGTGRDTWMGGIGGTWMGRIGDTWMIRIVDTWMGRVGIRMPEEKPEFLEEDVQSDDEAPEELSTKERDPDLHSNSPSAFEKVQDVA
uniref:Uncharacterized protein n=1 Tax=Parascaris equorum TaxID=6256 RepID=A0A914RQ99_PAREQ